MSKTRLLLVDDHSLFRESLARLLQSRQDLEVVGDCASITAGLEVLRREPVDLILLDYDLGQEKGFQFIEQARLSGITSRIMIVTAGMTDAEYVQALAHGVSGIVLKHTPPAELIDAISKIMSGETWVDQRCIRALADAVKFRDERERTRHFTERERRVLKGVFEGLSNKEIGVTLNLSEASVKSALQQLFLKTGVRTRSQLVRVALDRYPNEWRGVR